MTSIQSTITAESMEPRNDIAILYEYKFDCIALLTLHNGLIKFYNKELYSDDYTISVVSPTMIDMCREYDTQKKPMFFNVKISEKTNTVYKILDFQSYTRAYVLNYAPLETILHLLQMKHDREMMTLKQGVKESLRLFKSKLDQGLSCVDDDIGNCITDMYVKNNLL